MFVAYDMTSSPRWKEILHRNNDAIDRIQESQLSLGIQILRDVLQEMKGLLRVVPSLPLIEDKGMAATTAVMATSKATVLLHTVTLSQMQRCSHQDTASPFHLYNRAFKCINTTLENSQEASEVVTSLVIVVLYNLGLAIHLHGLLQDNEGHLRKALTLYNLATSKAIPPLSHTHGNWRMNRHLFKLTIALYNNQGHIHLHLGDMQQARECFFQIQRTVSTCVLQSVVLVMDDSDHFFLLSSLPQAFSFVPRGQVHKQCPCGLNA
jgi:tetratricopeptide (TPR) repeat protein